MMALTMTWPRPLFTARMRTRVHDAGELVAHEAELAGEERRRC